MNIEEFAPHMRPAGGLDDPSASEQFVEPGIAVGVDNAAEVLQVGLRVLALAVGRVEEQSGGRPRAGERPLVADVSPQPPGFGLAGARRQYRDRGVVDVQVVAGEDVGGQGIDQWLECRRRRPDPAGQGRGLQAHPVASEDLGLAIEWQVVVVLRDDDVSEQSRSGPPARDCVVWRRRRDHRVAGPAGQLFANVADHLETARHVIEGLGHLVADLAQRAAAAGTGAGRGVPQILSGQVLRQWAPRRLLRLGRGLDCRAGRRRCRRELFRLVSLQGLERQLELLGLARQLLRGTAKLDPPIPCQLEFQPSDLGLGGQRILRHSGDDAL